jgi:hypothetical protein
MPIIHIQLTHKHIYIYTHILYIYIQPMLMVNWQWEDPPTGQLGPTPTPIAIQPCARPPSHMNWAHAPPAGPHIYMSMAKVRLVPFLDRILRSNHPTEPPRWVMRRVGPPLLLHPTPHRPTWFHLCRDTRYQAHRHASISAFCHRQREPPQISSAALLASHDLCLVQRCEGLHGIHAPTVWSSLPDVVEERLRDATATKNHRRLEQPIGWHG